MFAILQAFGMFVADLFKSRSRLEAENYFIRHQLNIAVSDPSKSRAASKRESSVRPASCGR
jgi:hypothetical protein